jgi:dipeptidase E
MRLLLLSNSVAPGRGFLEHALESISVAMGTGRRLLFFAYASLDPDGYAEVMQAALRQLDVEVVPAHRREDLVRELDLADAIFVGGGNSFRLLKAFQDRGLLEAVRKRALEGLPYLGASAGSNLACPTIRTTNDMPIVEPRSLVALRLVPFQINPHYIDPDAAPFAETRDERIGEFLHENDVPVVGLREGAWLDVCDDSVVLGGPTGGRLFQRGTETRDLLPGSNLGDLLKTSPQYDSPVEAYRATGIAKTPGVRLPRRSG